MGRLDDHAKRRIVELRRAGLSFRKIKQVLELDDIRVTPQAVYLFLKRKSMEPGPVAAGWEGDRPWPPLQGHEAEPPRLLGTQHPALPTEDPMDSQAPCSAGSQDTKEGIQIVSVVSLCKDAGHLRDTLPLGLAPGNGDDSSSGTALTPVTALRGLASLPQPLPSQGQLVTPAMQNSALMVTKKTMGRVILLQKKAWCQRLLRRFFQPPKAGKQNLEDVSVPAETKHKLGIIMGSSQQHSPRTDQHVLTTQGTTGSNGAAASGLGGSEAQLMVKDASTQTALRNPGGPGDHSLAWGGAVAPSCSATAEKLDTVQAEVQKLSQALQVVLERQCRLERQQEHQQRLQQEVLMTLQQLRTTISHSAAPAIQPCGPFSSVAEPLPTMPNFSQFKMELV